MPKDPYRRRAGGSILCPECKAVFHGKRWVHDACLQERIEKDGNYQETTCPACRKIADRYPGGMLLLSGSYFHRHRSMIMSLIENECDRAAQSKPLERLMDVREENDGLALTTTTVSLSQRLGRMIHRAHKGDLQFKWSQGAKFARVVWQREE
ncbi:ATPase [bacterium]|nr:ATPase [candidate division CSSED10-310 bacterium]